ncbi:MAG: dienelactone hydrolase family protein [Balneolia bacterium]|nr:dienelactone hydrolase family protein [Balneolia bacterium]
MSKHLFENVQFAGKSVEEAEKVIILIHGRGATADSILGLMNEFRLDDAAYIAPQATNNTWYPYSFLKPESENEPWLSSAISLLDEVVDSILKTGKSHNQIVFMGFSQGACLASEYVARNAERFGGLIAFSGGVIGDAIKPEKYSGDFDGMPAFFGCSDNDFHIPEDRVYDSESLFKKLNAKAEAVIYPGMGHTINQDEILRAQRIIDSVK